VAESPIILVGAGKMGRALLSGWRTAGIDAVTVDTRVAVPDTPARVMVLAVKPTSMPRILPALRPLVGPDTVVLSIAAGKTIASLTAVLGDVAVVRAMPNTPAQVGRGITAAVAHARATAGDRALVTTLLEAVGEVVWLEDEGMLDAVTAISGSGPAYAFYLAECLARAGEHLGLPLDLAARLAGATVIGAGELLHRSDLTPAELRKNVTSPGGTTAAADRGYGRGETALRGAFR
jgi:pyrroline-5-carboxylate reductase